MALRGNLRDFSLPDVFQLVTFSKKTGVLRIRRADGAAGSVWFRDGDVFFAQSNWHQDPLGQRMVAAQKITPNALSRALEMRASEPPAGRRLGQILVDEGYVSDKILEAFVQEQIQDTIFDLMRWDEGDFDFETMPEVLEEDIGLSVSIENIVMEGARRLEEWTRIKKKVPSMDIVFKMATAPGEGTFEISLKPIEWQLLLLVDGTRSVSELAVETGRTDFEVARIIYGLFSAGLLEIAGDDEVERLRAERARRDARLAEIRRESELAAKSKAARPSTPTEPAAEAPAEEPEFLTAGPQAASAEDMVVFEQMMGAVLETPQVTEAVAAAAIEPAVAEEVAPEAVEPAPEIPEEPGVFAAMPELPAEVFEEFPPVPAEPAAVPEPTEQVPSPFEAPLSLEDLSLVEDLLPPEVAVPSPEPVSAEEPVFEVREPASEVAPQMTGDLERDLMALGLGELPSEDLLTPVLPEKSEAAAAAESEPTIAELERLATGGLAPEQVVPAETEGLPEHEAWAMPPEVEAAAAIEEPAPAEISEVLAELTEETPVPEPEGPDFSDLLSSLESPAIEERGAAGEEPVALETMEAETAGVISTDAFLDEIGGVDLGAGIGDELTALTGGGGMGRQRPMASVKKIPEPGAAGGLHMDQMVDKDLVLKIIDGIKSL
ncbi:MAG: hypothetical protein C0418_01585 [Coriobacteriaceae bacterium]|nr:hypothetical protein [Coriobacteriaceae bacterium]